jgi:tRNA dimethylallyltransferase
VAEFQSIGRRAIEAAKESHGRVIIAGGSGLHFRALVDPLSFAPTDPGVRAELEALDLTEAVDRLVEADPMAGEYVDLANPRRVVRALEIARLTGETPTERHTSAEAEAVRTYRSVVPFTGFGIDAGDRSGERIEGRFHEMLELGLLDEVARLQPHLGRTAAQAVGYKELLPVVRGEATIAAAAEDAIHATRALAKRQRTFFRRDPRIRWLTWEDDTERGVDDAVAMLRELVEWTS